MISISGTVCPPPPEEREKANPTAAKERVRCSRRCRPEDLHDLVGHLRSERAPSVMVVSSVPTVTDKPSPRPPVLGPEGLFWGGGSWCGSRHRTLLGVKPEARFAFNDVALTWVCVSRPLSCIATSFLDHRSWPNIRS